MPQQIGSSAVNEDPFWRPERAARRKPRSLPWLALVLASLLGPAPLAAESIAVPEALGPVRELSRSLDNLHFHIERLAGADVRLRVTASYFWHMATESQGLLQSLSRGMDTHELLSALAHLQGWFQYTEPKVRASVVESEMLDEWDLAHTNFVQVASLILPRLDPSIEQSGSRHRRLEPSALDSLRVPSRFEEIVEREERAGKLADPHLNDPPRAINGGYWRGKRDGTPSRWTKPKPAILGTLRRWPRL